MPGEGRGGLSRPDLAGLAWAWAGVRPTALEVTWARVRLRAAAVAYGPATTYVAIPVGVIPARSRPAVSRHVLATHDTLIPLEDELGEETGVDLAVRIFEVEDAALPLIRTAAAQGSPFADGPAEGFLRAA